MLTQRPPAQEAESKLRTLTTVWNVLDFMAFFPPLLETALLYGAKLSFSLGRFDLRWFKILRCPPSLRQALLLLRHPQAFRPALVQGYEVIALPVR